MASPNFTSEYLGEQGQIFDIWIVEIKKKMVLHQEKYCSDIPVSIVDLDSWPKLFLIILDLISFFGKNFYVRNFLSKIEQKIFLLVVHFCFFVRYE